MIRTQISLEARDMDRLRRLARERGVSMSSLLRSAVGRFLVESSMGDRRARARAVSGRFRWTGSGRDHDAQLVDAFER